MSFAQSNAVAKIPSVQPIPFGSTSPGAGGHSVQSSGMFVSDLRHFLDLPDDAPGPARKMAEQLGNVVRVATAAEAGAAWVSALPCRRRPGRRLCPGRIAVLRPEVPARIEWRCTSCGDEGVVSGWEGTYFDLRTRGPRRHDGVVAEVVVSDDVAATLRDLRLLDTECARLVYRARAVDDGVALAADEEGLDELIGCVAAEANHEPNRRRQERLDRAFAVLSDALDAMGS